MQPARALLTTLGLQRNQLVCSSNFHRLKLRNTAAIATLPADDPSADVEGDLKAFDAVYSQLERDLTQTSTRYADVQLANNWFQKVLSYNMTGGGRKRGLAVVQSYKILAHRDHQTTDNLRLANIMGWCLELLHTSLVLTQDLIDQAKERRGKPCWYLLNPRQAPDGAARLIETAVYTLLKKYFRNQDYYVDAIELFHSVGQRAMLGKVLDMEARGDPTLSKFDMTTYTTISKYRNAYHTFKLPVSLALYMAGIRNPEMHRQSRTIQLEMGNFYQAQCDFSNCYGGGPWRDGPGHDIQDGRCTWLIVVALQRATREQRQILIDNYGKNDDECVNRVKEVYNDLSLPHTYRQFEEHSYELICRQIQQTSGGLPHQLFFRYLKTLTGR